MAPVRKSPLRSSWQSSVVDHRSTPIDPCPCVGASHGFFSGGGLNTSLVLLPLTEPHLCEPPIT